VRADDRPGLEITAILAKSRQRYGSPGIQAERREHEALAP
jgi:hypothetical protein